MNERRKHNRLPITIKLSINELFKQDNELIEDVDIQAYIINISKTGIGLECKTSIPIGYYFDARIDLSDKEHFYCVVKSVRVEEHEHYFIYGCEFVGLAGILADKIDAYEQSL